MGGYEESQWRYAREVTLGEKNKKDFTLNELLEVFHNIESAKDEILEMNPNVERRIAIQDIKKRTAVPYAKLY